MEGVLHWMVRWACRTRDFCPALAALVGLVQNTFCLTVTYFNSFVPFAQQLVRQSCGAACLLVCVFGRESLQMI